MCPLATSHAAGRPFTSTDRTAAEIEYVVVAPSAPGVVLLDAVGPLQHCYALGFAAFVLVASMAGAGVRAAAQTREAKTVSDAAVVLSEIMAAPDKAIPQSIVDKTNAALKDILARPAIQEQLAKAGSLAHYSTAPEFNKLIADDVAKWKAVRDKAGLEPQ